MINNYIKIFLYKYTIISGKKKEEKNLLLPETTTPLSVSDIIDSLSLSIS